MGGASKSLERLCGSQASLCSLLMCILNSCFDHDWGETLHGDLNLLDVYYYHCSCKLCMPFHYTNNLINWSTQGGSNTSKDKISVAVSLVRHFFVV
jgi:hypothetical protein